MLQPISFTRGGGGKSFNIDIKIDTQINDDSATLHEEDATFRTEGGKNGTERFSHCFALIQKDLVVNCFGHAHKTVITNP